MGEKARPADEDPWQTESSDDSPKVDKADDDEDNPWLRATGDWWDLGKK